MRRPSAFDSLRHLFCLYLHQDDIVPYLANIAEGDDILLLPAQESADAARALHDQRQHTACTYVEIHIAHILDARGIEYEAQARTENGKKPDFLFPSQAAYEDPTFPETQLRMLASKTSIKDRFRQVADEANRIRDKHLFTLTPGDVTHPKLAQLDELHIHLVMPKVVKESYDDLIQGETMTFSRFIEEVQGLQAGRPQSLTLL